MGVEFVRLEFESFKVGQVVETLWDCSSQVVVVEVKLLEVGECAERRGYLAGERVGRETESAQTSEI